MMKKIRFLGCLLLLAVVFSAHASGNFRLTSGKLISAGKSKSEVIAIAGSPEYQDVETIAVDKGLGGHPIKREILVYRLEGSIGGMYSVVVTVENNIVVRVQSTQESRL